MISRLFSVSNIFTQRCLLNSGPDHSLFKYSEICLSTDPQKLPSIPRPSSEIQTRADQLNTFLSPFISKVEANICKTLKIDLKTLEKINKYFQNTHDKNFYAKTMLILAKSLGTIKESQELFAQIIEMTHFGSVLHSNLRESEDSQENKLFGEKGKILGGDFMISNASILCCTIDSMPLIQLLCVIVQNFSRGHYSNSIGNDFQSSFMAKVYLRDVSMLAHACSGIALLGDFDQKKSYEYGAHVAMAYKIINDVKSANSPKAGIISFPSYLAGNVIKDQNTAVSDGISKSIHLAQLHIEAAVEIANTFDNSEDLQTWAKSLMFKLTS